MNPIRLIIIIIVAALVAAGCSSGPAPVDRIGAAAGSVTITDSGGAQWEEAVPGRRVVPFSRIRTGKSSGALVMLKNGSEIRLARNTVAVLHGKPETEKEPGIKGIVLETGEASLIIKRARRRGAPWFIINTPGAVISTGGAELLVRAGGDNIPGKQRGAEIFAISGSAAVTGVQGDPVSLADGQAIFVRPSVTAPRPVDFNAEKLKTALSAWTAALVEGAMPESIDSYGMGGCPSGMVDIPAGHFVIENAIGGSVVFVDGFCVDTYEYPNVRGGIPLEVLAPQEAVMKCAESGKRLCSGEEWERACRGPDKKLYPYGIVFDAAACNVEGNEPEPAGIYSLCANDFGLFDMVGNLWEFNSSDYSYYMGNSLKEQRGGSWNSRSRHADCVFKDSYMTLDFGFVGVGFRCCK